MILKNSLIALLITSVSAFAQGLTGVMVNSNGVVQRPTNFISANNLATNQGSTEIDFVFPVGAGTLERFSQGANMIADGTNSAIVFGVDGTSSNALALVRMMEGVNAMGTAGTGTDWSDEMNFYMNMDGLVRMTNTGSIWRTVIGGNRFGVASNIAEYPTNKAIGLELQSFGSTIITNRVRLIAHNGTTATNGPWVVVSDIFNKFNILIKHKGTNGVVELWHSQNWNQPTNNTNATITGGPVSAAVGANQTWDAGYFQPTTNNGNSGVTIWKAYWQHIKPY